jgi:hypothetical protein
MSGVLSFQQYLGGPDSVIVLEMFPKSQKTFSFNFGTDVSEYTFTSDYQTIVLDTIAYDRNTGNVNFNNTKVIGYFDNTTEPEDNIDTADASSGVVRFTIPEQRYTGTILPNARQNVVMTVISFEWATAETPPQKELNRFAIIERWEPGVEPGDPVLETGFISLINQ